MEYLMESLLRDDPASRVFRLNHLALTSDEVFDLERAQIFEKCWLFLGHESEIRQPGQFLTRTLGGKPLIFCRDDTGKLHVFFNVCPHRGAQVCRDHAGQRPGFRCFYHSWTFRNDGTLIGVPAGESYSGSFDKKDFGLRKVPRVHSYRGFVFVNFDPTAEDLETYLAGAKDYLDAVADHGPDGVEVIRGTQLYAARANWKLLVENTMDFYHTVPVHTSYFTYLRDRGADLSGGVGGRGYDLGNGHGVVVFKAGWGRPVARWQPSWGEDEKCRLEGMRAELVGRLGEERAEFVANTDRNMVIFPNLLLNDIMATVLRQANPIAPGYMEVTQWALAPVGESKESRARRLRNFNTFLGPGGFATPDDIEALEGCQRGFAAQGAQGWSDYSRGYDREAGGDFTGARSDDEIQLRAFYRRWYELISRAEA